MMNYRCKCGELTATGTMPPDACYACPKCGSNLASSPNSHSEPLPHDYSAIVEQMGPEGLISIPVCRYCFRPRWKIEADKTGTGR